MAIPLIIYGPPGCGKTRYAQSFAKAYQKRKIADGENLTGRTLSADTLYLVDLAQYAAYRASEDYSEGHDAIPFNAAKMEVIQPNG